MFLSEPPFNMLDTLSRVDTAIDANSDIADAILQSGLQSMGMESTSNGIDNPAQSTNTPEWQGASTKADLDKARSTIHQLYRDWSAEGIVERAACYNPVLADLHNYVPPDNGEEGIRVLVPGAGLGRLVFEICAAGYHAEGNEISYHQLLTSSFILNHTRQANEWPLYPWALNFSNHVRREDQLRKVMIPDVHPASLRSSGSMGMTTGDFCVLYRGDEYKDAFDAVTTVFFIDTAPNLITYIETVLHCLKPGGVWINLGPLLWHFEERSPKQNDTRNTESTTKDENLGIGESGSFELSEDEVVKLLEHLGFLFLKHDVDFMETGYVQSPRSMLRSVYRPSHWVVRKP
jgi:carnosine N-methyltransferase